MQSKNKRNNNESKKKVDIKKIVDPLKLKSLGITRENSKKIEEVDGENIIGGKDTDPTVKTQWPTTNN